MDSFDFTVGDCDELERFLDDRIYEFNAHATSCADGESFAAVKRDISGTVVAGVAGYTWCGCCYVSHLWVDESLRGRGIGRALLECAESHAKQRGCTIVLLSSHSFQAPGFYERLGYLCQATVADHPVGHTNLVLAKRLGPPNSDPATDRPRDLYHRHALPVRLLHWITVVAVTVLFMSGLNIFSAHPALYWGKSSYTGMGPVFQITSRENDGVVGVTRLFDREFVTTGVLGASAGTDGATVARTFPSWLTLPSDRWLSMARRWHFFFAWVFAISGLCYLAYSIASRHLSRDLALTVSDWRSIWRSLVDHLRFRHPSGEAAKRYNVLQKLAYLGVVFGLLPLLVLTGLAMSPWLNSVIPGWVDVLGGRQSARTIHFIVAWLLVAFVSVHVFEVIVSGFFNHMRSMITGRFRIQPEVRNERTR